MPKALNSNSDLIVNKENTPANECFYFNNRRILKDTHKEKAPSNKTPALSKSMNMDIWLVGTLNQECFSNILD